MFVRFRQQGRRLQASLMQTRRVSGKMQSEHIASLGSVDAEVSVRERLAFWAKLPERLARLANRVGPDDQAKVYAALHARIPMVTLDEQRAIQEANAEDDERFWDAMRDMGEAGVAGHKALIASAEKRIAKQAEEAAEAAERAQTAKDRLERIGRGESVAGGLGKPLDVRAALKAAGWTPRKFRRAQLQWSLSEAEFETALANTNAAEAVDRAFDREALRVIRARPSP